MTIVLSPAPSRGDADPLTAVLRAGAHPMHSASLGMTTRNAAPVRDRGIRAHAILPRFARRKRFCRRQRGLPGAALEALLGKDASGLSAQVIGRLKAEWEAEHERWRLGLSVHVRTGTPAMGWSGLLEGAGGDLSRIGLPKSRQTAAKALLAWCVKLSPRPKRRLLDKGPRQVLRLAAVRLGAPLATPTSCVDPHSNEGV